MTPTELTLTNRYLTAGFHPVTGALIRIQAANNPANLIAFIACRVVDGSDGWIGEGVRPDEKGRFEAVRLRHGPDFVEAVVRGAGIEVVRRFDLAPASPLLRVGTKIKSRAVTKLPLVGLPYVQFAPDFVDSFEDDQDLYFDGAEMGRGLELPPWRVFFRQGHQTGLLVATRSRHEMAHFDILADGFRVQPHLDLCYSIAVPRPSLDVKPGRRWHAEFEIGPWSRPRHAALLLAAQLNRPGFFASPPARGKPARGLKGKVFRAVRFAPASITSKNYHAKKWMAVSLPWVQGGKALYAGPGVTPPAITLNPGLKGIYKIAIGCGNGMGITLRLSGDPEPSFRLTPKIADGDRDKPFGPYLSGRQRPVELTYGAARLDGRCITFDRIPPLDLATVFDYVRFERLSPVREKAFLATQDRKPIIPLSGFSDTPDISLLTDTAHPDPAAYRAVIWEHANNKFERVFWRIDGQCSDYPSKINTMRYVSAKVHGVFTPQTKAYGRVLKKTDMLKLAVDAGKKYGVQVWGWMRFNSYMGNVQSDFYKQHPEYWEEWENGRKGGKLCLAFPEVRRHKIDILCEAAAYGLAGVQLGFLRHPPVLQFAPILVESYRAKYGVLPPRDPKHPDAHFTRMLPPDDPEHTRFYQHRADYLTGFGRELRQAFRGRGLGHVKVSIWVRPNHCLFDGIDLPAWLNENLCDEVVADAITDYNSIDTPVYAPRPEWRATVQAKAKLVRGAPFDNPRWLAKNLPEILAQGYDGLCTYESNITVIDSRYRDFCRSLCR